MNREWNVNEIRKDFPIFQSREMIYLDNSATSQKPYQVMDAVTEKRYAGLFMQKVRMKLFSQGTQRKV